MDAVRIASTIDPLVVMADNRRNVVVCGYLSQNTLPDHRMFLHGASLFECQRPFFP